MKYLFYLQLQFLCEIDYILRFFHLKADKIYWADLLLLRWGFIWRLCLIMRIYCFLRNH